MKNIFILFIVVVFVSECAYSQQIDIVRLKIGKSITGQITASSDEFVSISTSDGMEYTYPVADIKRIKHHRQVVNNVSYILEAGIACFGAGRSAVSYEGAFASLYRLRPRLLVGGGVAVQYLNYANWYGKHDTDVDAGSFDLDKHEKGIGVPIYAEARYFLTRPGMFAFFADLKAGYRVGKSSGFYLSPMVGVMVSRTITFGVGASFWDLRRYYTKVTYTGYIPSFQGYGAKLEEIDMDKHKKPNFWLRLGVKF